MSRLGRVLLALVCSIVVIPIGFILGFYLLLAVDSDYHDGISGVGGLAIAGAASVATFLVVIRKTRIRT
jgi:hypothetical protein